jgi:hypothetical protein
MISKSEMVVVAVCAVLLGTTPAAAQREKISLHGYGGWVVGYSDPHPYLSGAGDGELNFENGEFVLLLEARPAERLRIVFAPEFEFEEGKTETKVELLYAEWAATDHVALQLGRGRLPFGLYADIYDVGTLRPFFHLPQAIYGKTGFVSEFFDGLGVVGRGLERGDWGLQWNLFAGGASLQIEEPFEAVVPGDGNDVEGEGAEGELETIAGGRLVVTTPLEGLSVGASTFFAEPKVGGDFASDQDARFGDFTSFSVSAELLRGAWSVRGEFGHHDENEFDTDASYLEASYKLGDHWQLAARYDSAEVSFVGDLPVEGRSTLEHQDLALGLNYWFNSNFVLKTSFHQVEGNLFAHPDAEALAPGVALDDRTDLVLFGTQFSF